MGTRTKKVGDSCTMYSKVVLVCGRGVSGREYLRQR